MGNAMKIAHGSLMVLILLFSGFSQARQVQPIVNIESPAIGASGKKLTAEQVRGVLASAAQSQGWLVVTSKNGNFIISKSWMKHTITSEIKYTSSGYSIHYKDSINMNFTVENGVPSIHPGYNKYVHALDGAIRNRLFAY